MSVGHFCGTMKAFGHRLGNFLGCCAALRGSFLVLQILDLTLQGQLLVFQHDEASLVESSVLLHFPLTFV